MRLSQDKIHDLAAQILAMMQEQKGVHVDAPDDAVKVAIGSAILDDMREEADIEEEADALVAKHAGEMAQADMDPHAMRQKFKLQIAKQRGFTL